MSVNSRGRTGRDDGTTTVLFSVVVLLLFAFAALGVELTSLYARDRAVQTVADVTALSAAQELPDACRAVNLAVAILSAEDNAVQDDGGNPVVGRTGDDGRDVVRELTPTERAALSDRDLSNGEIQLLTEHDPADDPPADTGDPRWLDTSGCTGDSAASPSSNGAARFVRVVVPPRTVQLTFANVFTLFDADAAPDSAQVSATATAGIRAPEGAVVLPLYVTDSCAVGPVTVVAAPASDAVTFAPPGADDGPGIVSVSPDVLPARSAATIRVRVTGLVGDPDQAADIGFDFTRAGVAASQANPPTRVDDVDVQTPEPPADPAPASPADATADPSAGPTSEATADPSAGPTTPDPTSEATDPVPTDPPTQPEPTVYDATFTLTVGSDVTSRGGEWSVRAQQPGADGAWTPDDRVGTFLVEDSCEGSGALNVRRASPGGDSLVADLAGGVDHDITSFPDSLLGGSTAPTTCDDPGDRRQVRDVLVAGVPVDGVNCLQVAASQVGGELFQGLVDPDPDPELAAGRLDPAQAPVTPANVSPDCTDPDDGTDFRWQPPAGGPEVVNTVLSCYLAPGKTLGDVLAGKPAALAEEIYSDPRFFFLPVLSTTPSPGEPDTFYAVTELRAAFLTDETFSEGTRQRATCGEGHCNGLRFASGSTLASVQLFTFPATALPSQFPQATNGRFYPAGTKEVVLFR